MSGNLKKVFDFDEKDILLNQNGRLSEKQNRLIYRYERINKIGRRISFVVMIISMSLFIAIPIYALGIDYLKKYPEILYSFIAVFSIAWLLFIISTFWGQLSSDIKARRISSTEGVASDFKTKKVRQWKAYYATIGGVRFQLDTKEKYSAFEPNIYYRIFYIRNSPTHIILSATEKPLNK